MTLKEDRLVEGEDKEFFGGRAGHLALASVNRQKPANQITSFDRRELSQILQVYGRKVADGEWRDYAIDHYREEAVFSVFRRASEIPLYRIVKQPRLARRQGEYSVVAAATGHILKRGHDLSGVLRAIDRKLKLVEA
jgi:hypothetical protein